MPDLFPNDVTYPAMAAYDQMTAEPDLSVRGQTGLIVLRGTDLPVEILDLNRLVIRNSTLTVNQNGYLPAFIDPAGVSPSGAIRQLSFKSGEITQPIDSPQGWTRSAAGSRVLAEEAREEARAIKELAESGAFVGPRGPEGPQGLPGPSAVPTDDTVATLATVESATRTALLTQLTTPGTRPVGKTELMLNLRDFGAKGDGVTDDSMAWAQAHAAATASRKSIGVPPGDYVMTNCGVGPAVKVVGLGADTQRFGPSPVRFRNRPDATTPLLVMNGGGVTLEGIVLDGNAAPGTVMQVLAGFEARMKRVRIINGGGIGLDVRQAGNPHYEDVFVDNCGSATLPAVRISSSGGTGAINTLDFTGLTIERAKGVHLQIGQVGDATVPEFVRLIRPHIEAVTDNGGINNTQPLIDIAHARSVTITDPFLYTGPGPAIRHNQWSGYTGDLASLGGITVIGGTILGKAVDTGARPERLIDLVAGNEFVVSGTRLDGSQYAPVRIGANYGDRVVIAPDVIFTPRTGGRVEDLRTTPPRPMHLIGRVSVLGHLISEQSANRPVATGLVGLGTGAPAPSLSLHTDTRGVISFGTGTAPSATAIVQVAFNKSYGAETVVMLAPSTAATAALGLYVSPWPTGGGFTVYASSSPAASAASGTYQMRYLVMG